MKKLRLFVLSLALTLGGVAFAAGNGLPDPGYAVTVGGQSMRVEPMRCSAMPVNIRWPGHQRYKDQTEICAFTRFDFRGETEIAVTPKRQWKNAVVRPVAKKIAVRRDGDALRFTIKAPGAYSVECDGRHCNLMVFADPPRDYSKVDRRAPNVRYYGPGEHDVGLIEMKSGETLFIDEGAVVYGRIHAYDAKGIRICGRGILDASRVKEEPIAIDPKLAEEQRRKGWAITNVKRYNTIDLFFCDDAVIDGITLRDSQIYAVRPVCCRNFTVENMKIVGSWRYNSDGIDMHNCRGVRIRDSFIRTFDDSICVKGFDYIVPESEIVHNGVRHDLFEDVVVERCTIWNDWGRALEIGAETRAREIRDVTFRDCDVIAVHAVALDVQNCDQALVHDIRFENIRIEYDPLAAQDAYSDSANDFDPKRLLERPVPFFGALVLYIPEYSKAGAENRGNVRDVYVRDIDIYSPKLPGCAFRDFDADHCVRDIHFERIRLNGVDRTADYAVYPQVHTPPSVTPFVMMRIEPRAITAPDAFRERIAANGANPGSADAYWPCGGEYAPLDRAHAFFGKVAAFKPDCAKAGVRLDYQQGVTLGHGDVGTNAAALFPKAALQIGRDGQVQPMFCPRAPEVLDYETKWIADLCRTVGPKTIWLDDDLRMGYLKNEGCFCDRCVKAFNERFGHQLTREQLLAKLFADTPREPLRRDWVAFVGESVASYAAAARKGAADDCIIAYQSVNAHSLIAAGRDLTTLLAAMSGNGEHPTAVRIGSECYFEDVAQLSRKLTSVARESERLRQSQLKISQICYEQENFTREVLHKSVEAALVESALALACGCDSLSEYRWDGGRDEPASDYREFAERMALWRPYLERLGKLSRRTALGGVARFVGSDADLGPDFTLEDPFDVTLADLGVPVTVAEAYGAKGSRRATGRRDQYYLNEKSLAELSAADLPRLLESAVVVEASVWDRFRALDPKGVDAAEKAGNVVKFDLMSMNQRGVTVPTTYERLAMLDAFDRTSPLPVRINRAHRFRVMPRLDRLSGRVVAVTLWNESAGASLPTEVRIRRPAGMNPIWAAPKAKDAKLEVQPSVGDELVVVIPEIPARQVATIFL